MAKFSFYQDKEVKTWVRDYFEVEAETKEEAIAFLKEQEKSLESLEYEHKDKVQWEERDNEVMLNSFEDYTPLRFSIFDSADDEEIVSVKRLR